MSQPVRRRVERGIYGRVLPNGSMADSFEILYKSGGRVRRQSGFSTVAAARSALYNMRNAPQPRPSKQPMARDDAGGVYFIQSGEDGPIKVGWSDNGVQERIRNLQCGNPLELRLIGLHRAARTYEGVVHLHFTNQHIRGEWFHPTSELIAWATTGPPSPHSDWLRGPVNAGMATKTAEMAAYTPSQTVTPARRQARIRRVS